MATLVRQNGRAVARPLRVLVPLIKDKIDQGDIAGAEYYRQAGELLLEAKDSGQIALGSFGAWANRTFRRSASVIKSYMQLARKAREAESDGAAGPTSVRQATGHTERLRDRRHSERPMFEAIRAVDIEFVAQDRQSKRDEVRMHRELALELIDIGYKALATRLHPDRGGSKDAMRRLNKVRDELKSVAETRRFE